MGGQGNFMQQQMVNMMMMMAGMSSMGGRPARGGGYAGPPSSFRGRGRGPPSTPRRGRPNSG
jgi:hypothetical protein